MRVYRKGTGTAQWLPASPEAFTWLRLYLADLGVPLEPDDLVWQTLRRRDEGDGLKRQPMNYEALRAVFRRVNALLGSNGLAVARVRERRGAAWLPWPPWPSVLVAGCRDAPLPQ